MPSSSCQNIESEVRAVAHRHLGDADDEPKELLRRLDRQMQKLSDRLSMLETKEALSEQLADLLKQGSTTRSPSSILDDLRQ